MVPHLEHGMELSAPFTARVSLAELSRDPYPIYAALRSQQPVAWIPEMDSWLVTRYHDVRAVLLDSVNFITGTPRSLIYETFGEQMLTVEGDLHKRYRDSQTQAAFMPKGVRDAFEGTIAKRVSDLVDGFIDLGTADIRTALAARLPVLVMLDVFGLPQTDEVLFRRWYDSFEASLANHARDSAVFEKAASNVREFHEYFQRRIEEHRIRPGSSFLDRLLARPEPGRLTDDELRRNALIIFFGGISTVEALILNTLWALLIHPREFSRVVADRGLIERALDETMRWVSPVQSAMRHPLRNCVIAGVSISAGATVNCMLGSANRDEGVFDEPDKFSLDRRNVQQHLGFATGPHACLGRFLAKAEARAAIATLLERVSEIEIVGATEPVGHEFRQPRTLMLRWR
jgi:cytochrome P450